MSTAAIESQRNRVFQALSDPTRRQMLSQIAQRSLSVAELSEPFPISAPAISKHLKVLENSNLIERIKDGKQRRFRLNTEPLADARAAIDQLAAFWNARFDALDELLKQQQPPET